MKRAILLLTAIVTIASVIIVSCRKKSTDHTHCYWCVINDSLVSNIPALSNPHFRDTSGNNCGLTDYYMNFIAKKKTRVDTFTVMHDTVEISYWTEVCTLND